MRPAAMEIGGRRPLPRPLFARLRTVAFGAAAVFFTQAQAQAPAPLDPPLCNRTPGIQAAVLALTPEDDGCADFAAAALRSATLLDARYRGISVLQAEDFNDMDALEILDLSNNRLQALPDGMSSDLDTLLTLNLRNNRLRELAADVFDGAVGLKRLDLRDNRVEYLPPRIFENVDLGLSLTDGAGGSLLLSGNPGPDGNPQTPFAFVVDITVANPHVEAECFRFIRPQHFSDRCTHARTVYLIDFGLYLAQGAPFDISVRMTAENHSFDSLENPNDNDAGHIHDNYSRYLNIEIDENVEIQSNQVHATNQSLEDFRHSDRRYNGSQSSPGPRVSSVTVSVEVPSMLPDGNCGYSPCYDGFEIREGADVLYERRGETEGRHAHDGTDSGHLLRREFQHDRNRIPDVTWPQTVVTAVDFSNPPHHDGYIAGLETVTVEVVFDRKLVVVEGKPLLKLEVGDRERDAAYVPSEGASDRLRFRYRFSADDQDSDGIRAVSLDSTGATIDDVLVGSHRSRYSPNLLLECCTGVVAAQKVRQVRQLLFDAASASGGEGETVDLRFTLSPPPTGPLAVNFSVGESDDVDVDGGMVEVPAGAETGTIRIQINDDENVEPARETFTVSLRRSGDYVPGVHSVVEVVVEEGVCDRKTPVIRDALMTATSRSDCAAVSDDDLALVRNLDLGNLGIDRLHARDFLGLVGLSSLNLQGNALQVLPPGVFEGLAQLGGASGSLLLDGNPGAPFNLTVETRIVETTQGADREDVTFEFYLAQGAPLDVAFDWDFHPPSSLRPGGADPTGDFSIPAGGTRSRPITLTIGVVNENDEPLGVQLGDLPALPSGDSGCGHDPCYAGFRFAKPPTYGSGGSLTDAHLIYTRDPRAIPRVTMVRFSQPQDRSGYIAGIETITVEVEFDEILFVELSDSGDEPSLSLDVGGRLRTATYVSSEVASAVLKFDYATRDDDFDADGVSVASADGFELNGAVLTGRFGKVPDLSLSDFLAPAAGRGVRRAEGLSFDVAAVLVGEGSMIELIFHVEPPPPSPLTVAYVVAAGGTEERGSVPVSAGAGSGVIRLQLEDDEDIESPDDGERFEVRLIVSGGYSPISPSRVAVTVREGVCDRTPQVREALTAKAGREDCAEVTGEDLVGIIGTLDLSSQGVTVLQSRDFSGLVNLQELNLQDNVLQTLPAGVFDALGKLDSLRLTNNQLHTLRADVFSGFTYLRRLRLAGNRLTLLPSGVFAGVNRNVAVSGTRNLWLFLEDNRLSSLPPGVFAGTEGLNWVNLAGNVLDKLPVGVFSGVPASLRVLDLRGNLGADFSLVLRAEFAGGTEALVSASGETVPVKVTLREGAPYRLRVDLGVSDGQASVSAVEIPTGDTQSETFTVTRAAGAARTVVPLTRITPSSPPRSCVFWQRSPPGNEECFNGLEVHSTVSLVLLTDAAVDASPPVCNRTPEIRDAILRLWDGDDCMNFPTSILRIVPRLDVSGAGLTSFVFTDFNNMGALEALDLSDNESLRILGAHAFGSRLSGLKRLDLSSSGLDELHPRAFAGLTGLEQLLLYDNDLRALPAELFSELRGLGGPAGSLRLEGNLDEGSPDFALTVNFEVNSFDADQVEFHLYLAQGAPFDVTFPLAVEGSVVSTLPAVTIPAGSTQSMALAVRRQAGQTLRLSLGDPPALPRGDSGCGYDPCYAGFEIAAGTPLIYDESLSVSPVVSMVEFISLPRHSYDGYVAGLETILVDVVFNKGLVIDTSGGDPSLELMVGSQERTATYVPFATSDDRLRFSYALTGDDSDDDGVSIASASGLQLNGAVIENRFGVAANTMLPASALNAFSRHKVRRTSLVSFNVVSVSGTEGSMIELPLRFDPPAPSVLAVGYSIGVSGDTADAADYTDPGSGIVSVPMDATDGTVRISIRDDQDVEPLRETFTVSLASSGDYFLSATTMVLVVVKEGVCDRTAQISTTLTIALKRTRCADVTTADLSGLIKLDASSLRITSLKQEDFSGLTQLESLWLSDNAFQMLPAGVFSGLGGLTELRLHGNALTSLPAGVFSGLGRLTALWLHENALTSLPAGVFSGLGGLTTLWLHGNALTTLPAGVFSGLGGLTELRLHGNALTSLPAGVFSGLVGLTGVDLSGNDGSTFTLTVKANPSRLRSSFESVAVKLVLREGAPRPITVSLSAQGATLSADSLTIPTGHVESDGMVTMTRTPGAFALTLESPTLGGTDSYPGIMIVTESPTTDGGVELRLRLFLEGALE